MRKAVMTDKAPKPMGPYSQAIIEGDFIFLAGQGPNNPETGQHERGDIASETTRTLENIKAILEAAGSSLDKVVKCNVYLRDINDFAGMNAVYTRYFSGPPPARTTIQAGALPGGIAVEIEAVAPMNATDLDTPCVYVALDVLERNIRAMQERCRAWGVHLRPHTKTHKIAEIARMQLEAGAIGITVAKIGEAEVLPGDDVLIAYPIMADKLERLRALGQDRRVTVVLDSVEAARGLPGIGALVEVDVGAKRCGVETPEQAVAVARACSDFRGLFYWPSWLEEAGFQKARVRLDAHIAALEAAGFEVPIVSGGSTPGVAKTPLIPRTTEIRPGTYVFNDANCVKNGFASLDECALRVLVTVVSTAVSGQALVDGGTKTFSSDATVGGAGTFGIFPDRPAWTMHQMNEEHGYVKIDSTAKIGEKLWVVPSHVCTTVNMHDEIAYGRAGRVEGTWRVAARGKVR